jgi:hypothetical protein
VIFFESFIPTKKPVKAAIKFEFNLPLPEGESYGRAADVFESLQAGVC